MLLIYQATSDWLQVAYPRHSGIDWEAEPVEAPEWEAACTLAGFDASDQEVGFAILVAPRPCDTCLREGDIVATSGPGGAVAFLRRVG